MWKCEVYSLFEQVEWTKGPTRDIMLCISGPPCKMIWSTYYKALLLLWLTFFVDYQQKLKSYFPVYSSVSVVNCTTSGDLLHGSISADKTSFSQVITIRCNTGYGINGRPTQEANLRCQADGTWNATEPSCTGTGWFAWHFCSMQCPILN